ncbi:MAG: hypothetical protein ABI600_15830 [Luteolibacter sp.]
MSLLILMIGMIAMLSLERRTARSYSDATRAEFALESGLSDALSTISEVASRDDTLVFRLEDPVQPKSIVSAANPISREQFFTYGSVFDTTKSTWRIIPFFSGAKETSPAATAGKPNAPDTVALKTALTTYVTGTASDKINVLGRVSETDTNVPRAKWVELPYTSKEYRIRYSWWVEDLSGRIDGRTAGSEKRELGLSTSELGIFTLFNNTADSDAVGPEDSLIAKRSTLRTAASSRLVLSENDSKKIEPYLTYSPTPAKIPVTPVPVIPQGYGYADAGKLAMDLNKAVAAKDVEGIASQITRNLPKFDNRKGGFPSTENYNKTIAASIIDYADTDSTATALTSTGADTGYRGVDSYPFVNELFDRYEWTGTSGDNVKIKVSTYAELWNPSQLSIKGDLEFENQNKHKITIPPSGTKEFTTAAYPLIKDFTLLPNGFRVVMLGEKTYDFPIGPFPPSQPTFVATTTSNYQLKWNGVIVDMARGGVQRTDGTLNPGASNRKWKGNSSPALDTSIGQAGDPRASYYINTWVFANTYDTNTSWGGRCVKGTIANNNYNKVEISKWPDCGSDSTPGTSAGSDAKLPTDLAFPANQPNMAPAFISNFGSYKNVGELGHIFDPSQFSNVNLTAGAISASAGGGYTLAIGRPEYGRFDNDGQRAAQLIDLFYVPLATPSTVPIGGKININTAPREVLRTLIAGVTLHDDLAQPIMYPPKQSIVGDLFADCVINTRNYAPLRGLSDLNLIRQDPATARNYTIPDATTEPFFGSRMPYPTKPADTWNDAGREELFKKVINLVSFQGKVFRIVVAGEALDRNGNLIGRANKEFHVMFEPQRDSAGLIDPNGITTIRKIYEKSL